MAEPAAKAHEAEDEVDVEAEAEEDTAAAIEMDRIEEEEEEEEKEEEAEGEAGHERGEETEVPPQETTGSQSAAKPFTAATLYTLEQAARSRFASLGSKIRTSCCSEFDDYLFSGGVERGIVLGLSGELDVSRLISFHLLASALLSTEAAERGDATGGAEKRGRVVSIIDTTGSFPLHLLVGVLRSRISELERREEVREARVSGLLERISITRIFDIEGFWEVLHSEFSSSTALGKENQLETRNEACQVLVVEPLSTLIYTLFSHAERSAALELITGLSTHLHTLTKQNNILTILLNTTTTTNTSSSTASTQRPNRPSAAAKPIFPTLPPVQTPALGMIFTQFLDTHIFISGALPKRRYDAEMLYASSSTAREKEGIARVYVLEVSLNAYASNEGAREKEGQWCAVEIEDGGEGLRNAFPPPPPPPPPPTHDPSTSSGLRRARDPGTAMDVGAVAKIYGFGGRRV